MVSSRLPAGERTRLLPPTVDELPSRLKTLSDAREVPFLSGNVTGTLRNGVRSLCSVLHLLQPVWAQPHTHLPHTQTSPCMRAPQIWEEPQLLAAVGLGNQDLGESGVHGTPIGRHVGLDADGHN